jgi:hypothetical protein
MATLRHHGSRASSSMALPYVGPCSDSRNGGNTTFFSRGDATSKLNKSPSCGAPVCGSSSPTRRGSMELGRNSSRGACCSCAFLSSEWRCVVCQGRENRRTGVRLSQLCAGLATHSIRINPREMQENHNYSGKDKKAALKSHPKP